MTLKIGKSQQFGTAGADSCVSFKTDCWKKLSQQKFSQSKANGGKFRIRSDKLGGEGHSGLDCL